MLSSSGWPCSPTGWRRRRGGPGREELAAKGGLAGTPEVDITGFPFLTQAVAGRYDDVRISLTADELGQPEGTRADVALRGVQVPLSSVLSGSVQEVPVDRIDGTATLSYELLAARSAATHAAPRGRRPADHPDRRAARADASR